MHAAPYEQVTTRLQHLSARTPTCDAVGSPGPGSWDAYVQARVRADVPAVHHSEAFERAYRPAYRVVDRELARAPSSDEERAPRR